MLQLHDLAAQPDIDGHDDLFDRAEAVGRVRARIARQIDQLTVKDRLAAQVGADPPVLGQDPRAAVDDLLVARCRRQWPAPGVVDQYLDRGTVDQIQRDDLVGAVTPQLEGGRIEHQDILECLAQPGGERGGAVGLAPELGQLLGAGVGAGHGVFLVARFDRPIERLDLVFAGLDRQPRDVVRPRQCSELGEGNRLEAARRVDIIVPAGKVVAAQPLRLRRHQRVARRKKAARGLEHRRELRHVALAEHWRPAGVVWVAGDRRALARAFRAAQGSRQLTDHPGQ